MPSQSTQSPSTPVTDAAHVFQRVLPQFLDALQALAEGKPDARERGETLLSQLERDAEGGEDESRAVWAAAAKVMRRVFVEQPGPNALIDDVAEWEDRPEHGWQAVCVLSYLGASVDPKTVPSLGIALHMTMAEFLYDATHELTALYEGVILPWFAAYWTRVFNNARFRFQAPRMVDTALHAALVSEPDVRLQRLLGAMGEGLNVVLPDEGKAWFDVRR